MMEKSSTHLGFYCYRIVAFRESVLLSIKIVIFKENFMKESRN